MASSMLSRVLKVVYQFTVYAVGVSVLLAAVLVTAIRLLLPDIGSYRTEVEAWVSRYMGFPVVFHTIHADWQGWRPHLYLTDIDLLNKAGTQPITHFDSAQINIDPLASLIHRRIVPLHLIISGFELSVKRQEDGSIYIEDIKLEKPGANQTKNNELAEWLFKQNVIQIKNAEIEWKDIKHSQEPVLLTDVNLQLRTDPGRLQFEGTTRLPAHYGENMAFAFDAHGNMLTSDWSGELYLQGKNINPDKWYKNYRPLNFNISGGLADIKVWSIWKRAKLTGVEGKLEYNDFTASVGVNSLKVQQLAYGFTGDRLGDNNWQFKVDLDKFVTENGSWPNARFAIATETDATEKPITYRASFNFLKLEDLSPLIGNLSFLPEKTKDILNNLSIKGTLSDGRIVYDSRAEDDNRFRYDMDFENVSTTISKELPGVASVSGHTYGTLARGIVSFSDDKASLHLPGNSRNNLAISQLTGDLVWKKDGGKILLKTGQLKFNNDDFSGVLSGRIIADKDASPFIDVVAEINDANLDRLIKYIPYSSRFKLRPWMERAVLGGKLNSGRAVFRGTLKDFPFNAGNGQFKVIADISDGVLEYSNKWPLVDNVDTEVILQGTRLEANFERGKVFNAQIKKGKAVIPNILSKHKSVAVTGDIYGGIRDLKTFIAQSPLINEPALKEIQKSLTNGQINLHLDLDIPIKKPGQISAEKPVIAGHIRFADSGLLSATGLEINKLNGEVSFTRGSVSGHGLTASYLGAPVTLDVSGAKNGNGGSMSLTFHGAADKIFIADRVEQFMPNFPLDRDALLKRIAGNTTWDLALTYRKDETSPELVRSMTIQSDLAGLYLNLPYPLGKRNTETVNFKITRRLDVLAEPEVYFNYGDEISSRFMLKKLTTGSKLRGADIALNTVLPSKVHKGIRVLGNLDKIPLTEWLDFIKAVRKETPLPGMDDIGINIKTPSLLYLGQNFQDTTFTASKTGTDWKLDLAGNDVSGEVILPEKIDRDNTIYLRLDKLHLEKTKSENKNRIDPELLPAIQAHVTDMSYGRINLGEMKLVTSPVQNGLAIDSITFSKPDLHIDGKGQWSMENGTAQSSFNLHIHAGKIRNMLETFGYQFAAIEDGETHLAIDAEWKGSPMEFSLDKLNGDINMQITNGQLLDIDPSAGRLFGLLSVQALPRRLTLDFRDLFNKGMSFDIIEGNFSVTNGNAYTNDMYMRGPAAEVSISGRTGLSNKDYDQRVTVTPQVADSLPVASALFGPVGIGVGAIFYLAGEMFESIHDKIDTLLRYQYTITGSWDQPVIEKISPRTEGSG